MSMVRSGPGPLAPQACALPMRHSTSTNNLNKTYKSKVKELDRFDEGCLGN